MSVQNLIERDGTATAVSILIVDDERDMRLLAGRILARAGIHVVGEAEDGAEAILKVQQLAPPPVPTVVLLDNRMPGMCGLDAAAQILQRAPTQLIILFSAFLDDETVAQAKRYGVAACVPKKDIFALPEIIRALTAPTS
jgi:CheY-like chemotaxis protein